MQVIHAISQYIAIDIAGKPDVACTLTVHAKYLQLAYSGAGNVGGRWCMGFYLQHTCKYPVDRVGKTGGKTCRFVV